MKIAPKQAQSQQKQISYIFNYFPTVGSFLIVLISNCTDGGFGGPGGAFGGPGGVF